MVVLDTPDGRRFVRAGDKDHLYSRSVIVNVLRHVYAIATPAKPDIHENIVGLKLDYPFRCARGSVAHFQDMGAEILTHQPQVFCDQDLVLHNYNVRYFRHIAHVC